MIVVEEAPVPALADGDVLVEVHAAAITPSELGWWPTWAHRDGSPRAPVVPGHEVAGIVVARRGNTDLAVGSRVFGLTDFFGDGAAAEYVAVRAADLAEWPVGVDAVSIAAIPLSALTAWQALFDQGPSAPWTARAGPRGDRWRRLVRRSARSSRGRHHPGRSSRQTGDLFRSGRARATSRPPIRAADSSSSIPIEESSMSLPAARRPARAPARKGGRARSRPTAA